MEHQSNIHSWPVTLVAASRRPMLACLVWYLVVIGIRFIPGVDRHMSLFMAFAVLSSIAATVAMSGLGRGKIAVLQLFPNRIVVGAHVLDRARLGAELAAWKEPYAHTTAGSALCLQDGKHALRIGGRDRLSSGGVTQLSVDRVDASLSADDFNALLQALSLSELSAAAGQRAQVAIDLIPSTFSARGMYRTLSTWIGTLALAGAIGLVAGALHFEQSPTALIAVQTLTVVVVLGGLALTIRRQSRLPRARYRLLIAPHQVLLEDTRSPPGRAATHGPPLRAERRFYRSTSRAGSFDYATVRLFWPSGRTDVIGVLDTTWRWPGSARRLRKLQYLVGQEAWRQLIAALRLI